MLAVSKTVPSTAGVDSGWTSQEQHRADVVVSVAVLEVCVELVKLLAVLLEEVDVLVRVGLLLVDVLIEVRVYVDE